MPIITLDQLVDNISNGPGSQSLEKELVVISLLIVQQDHSRIIFINQIYLN